MSARLLTSYNLVINLTTGRDDDVPVTNVLIRAKSLIDLKDVYFKAKSANDRTGEEIKLLKELIEKSDTISKVELKVLYTVS